MRRHVIVLGMLLGACGGEGPALPADGGSTDASGPCGATCDDGLYCNGTERCDPSSATADARGCVAGAPACAAGASCDETMRACRSDCADADGDGRRAASCGGDDCDDSDPNRFPGNSEVCDRARHDEDCDPSTFGFRDVDSDHYSDATCCNDDPSGMYCGNDCNDMNPIVHPDETDTCDGFDNDCNGVIDDGQSMTFYPDTDHDGYGDATAPPTTMNACSLPAGYATDPVDCDDTRSDVRPGAPEICGNGRDDNCNGTIDEPGTTSFTYYADTDHDGHGSAAASMTSSLCSPPAGYVTLGDDCDDAHASTYPHAPELCNRVDDDCSNGGVSSGGADPSEDVDGDGHSPPTDTCAGGFARDDCDDTVAVSHGGATEVCDAIDDDCDGVVDELIAARAACGSGNACAAGACVPGSTPVAVEGGLILFADGRIVGGRAPSGTMPDAIGLGAATTSVYWNHAVRADGTVLTDQGAWTPDPAFTGVVAAEVSSTNGPVCAVTRSRQVICNVSVLGTPAGTPIPAFSDIVHVEHSENYLVFLRASGAVATLDAYHGVLGSLGVSDAIALGVQDSACISHGLVACVVHRDGSVTADAASFPSIHDAVDCAYGAGVCVLRANGSIVCDTPGTPMESWTDATFISGFRACTDPGYSCAVRSSGEVWCWNASMTPSRTYP